MSKAPKAPQPVNPYQVGQAQQQSNINTALANAHLNNVNVNSPYGTIDYTYGNQNQTAAPTTTTRTAPMAHQAAPTQGLTYAQQLAQRWGLPVQGRGSSTPGTPAGASQNTNNGGTKIDGINIPQVTENIKLSPAEQQLLATQQSLQQELGTLGTKLASNIPTTALDYNNVQKLGDPGQINQQAENAVYQQQTAMLNPQWNEQQKQLEDSLSAQGIPRGSAAYTQAMGDFQRNKDLAYQQAKDSAIQEGYQVGGQTFNERLAGRQQGVGEKNTIYNQPSNTLAQLMAAYQGGNVQAPMTSTATNSPVAPSDITNAFGLAQAGQQANYGAQTQQYGNTLGGLTGLAGILALGAGL